MPGDTTKELKMKAKPVLVSVVLLAAVSLAGCISKTGTGTGDRFTRPAMPASDVVVANAPVQKTATQQAASGK
jgi:predicted small secreted protein